MSGRKYSAAGSYRYGFNGKENDNDVKGEGNQQDYGMRIYDSRLGKFLSTDPLTKSYPELTPYQFASNRPVDGVDLDGLEYVGSKDVRIKLVNGSVHLEMTNMTQATQGAFKLANENPRNWKVGEIGISTKVGDINFSLLASQEEISLDHTPGAPDPNYKAGEVKVENPKAKSTGLPDKRYKERTVNTATPTGSKALGFAALIIDVITIAWVNQINGDMKDDMKLVKTHSQLLVSVLYDVSVAVQEGLIDKKNQTPEMLSAISNYVLSSSNPSNNPDVQRLGSIVWNKVSKRRYKFDGWVTIAGKSQPALNPIYDANYGKNQAQAIQQNSASSSENQGSTQTPSGNQNQGTSSQSTNQNH